MNDMLGRKIKCGDIVATMAPGRHGNIQMVLLNVTAVADFAIKTEHLAEADKRSDGIYANPDIIVIVHEADE